MISHSGLPRRASEGWTTTSYEATISVLDAELAAVASAFAGLSAADWQRPTKLMPVDPDLVPWTVFELAGHFDISIGLTRMLVDGRDDSQAGRDRTSFFINPRSETAPVVYNYAYMMVDGKKAATCRTSWPRPSPRRSRERGRSPPTR